MKKNILFTNEMEAKPPTHHKKGITSGKKVWTFDPVWQLLWLRLNDTRGLIRLCFYIRTTWELRTNWLIRDALARSAPGEPANISRDVPLTTDHAISTEAHK